MSQLPNACLIAGLALAGCSPSPAPLAEDPHVWLEDVEGEQALDWVRARNARAEAELAANDDFKRMEADILAVLDSDAKIPGVEKIGAYYYNFWKDKNHERGIWRRTTLQEYRKAQPKWETVLDLDALNVEEGTKWVWHGADCLKPDYRRCLIALSPGGSDADVWARRKPILLFRMSGLFLLRFAERTFLGALVHEPPRSTRQPPLGPIPW
jgi:prolyl oligopeptidase